MNKQTSVIKDTNEECVDKYKNKLIDKRYKEHLDKRYKQTNERTDKRYVHLSLVSRKK